MHMESGVVSVVQTLTHGNTKTPCIMRSSGFQARPPSQGRKAQKMVWRRGKYWCPFKKVAGFAFSHVTITHCFYPKLFSILIKLVCNARKKLCCDCFVNIFIFD